MKDSVKDGVIISGDSARARLQQSQLVTERRIAASASAPRALGGRNVNRCIQSRTDGCGYGVGNQFATIELHESCSQDVIRQSLISRSDGPAYYANSRRVSSDISQSRTSRHVPRRPSSAGCDPCRAHADNHSYTTAILYTIPQYTSNPEALQITTSNSEQ